MVTRINHEMPGYRMYRGHANDLTLFFRAWEQKLVVFSSIGGDGLITITIKL